MSDIAKCENESCPLKDSCYRYTALANEFRQSYAKFQIDDESGECSGFWDNFEYKKRDNENSKEK